MALASPRSSARAFAPAPIDWHDEGEHRRKLAENINDIKQGRLNVTGTVTFTASQATTTVTDARASATSFIDFMPTTANAAGELGYYVSSQTDGSFVITHAVDSRTDRTFRYIIVG